MEDTISPNIEISEKDGLRVSINDETGDISFEWDPDTNPEYNYLQELTSESFSDLLRNFLDNLKNETNATEVSSGGQSS